MIIGFAVAMIGIVGKVAVFKFNALRKCWDMKTLLLFKRLVNAYR
jgi:hypothetical protein